MKIENERVLSLLCSELNKRGLGKVKLEEEKKRGGKRGWGGGRVANPKKKAGAEGRKDENIT